MTEVKWSNFTQIKKYILIVNIISLVSFKSLFIFITFPVYENYIIVH